MSSDDDLNLLLGLGNRSEGNIPDVNAGIEVVYGLPLFTLRLFDWGLDACFGSEAKLTDNLVPRPVYWRR